MQPCEVTLLRTVSVTLTLLGQNDLRKQRFVLAHGFHHTKVKELWQQNYFVEDVHMEVIQQTPRNQAPSKASLETYLHQPGPISQ